MNQVEQLKQQIEYLQASLSVRNLVESAKIEAFYKYDTVLWKYARGDVDGPQAAKQVLGVGEFWDAGYNKSFLRLRRVWRRIKEFFA